jgi:hypothetical protein
MIEKISDLDLEKIKNFQLQSELINVKYQNIILGLYLQYKLNADDKIDLSTGKIERLVNTKTEPQYQEG